MKALISFLVFLLLCLFPSASRARAPIKVAFINPYPDNAFWHTVSHVMQAAADDLGIHLTIYDALHWPTGTASFVKQIVTGPRKPDYLVFPIYRGMGASLLNIAEQAKVKVFIIDAGLLEADRKRYGGPRQHYKFWIGQMLPNNEQAGYDLANLLVNKARQSGKLPPGSRVKVLALGGIEPDAASVERGRGLIKALAERNDAELLQVVPANWSYQQALAKTPMMLKRYPDASVIWSANGPMGLGAIKALEGLHLKPGKDIFVGSIDWTSEELKAVAAGTLVASIGGHFSMGAWTMVLLHDYHYGLDFAKERVNWSMEMRPITRDNLARYKKLRQGNWDVIDFRAFSKKYHPGLSHYDFTVKALLVQLGGSGAGGDGGLAATPDGDHAPHR